MWVRTGILCGCCELDMFCGLGNALMGLFETGVDVVGDVVAVLC